MNYIEKIEDIFKKSVTKIGNYYIVDKNYDLIHFHDLKNYNNMNNIDFSRELFLNSIIETYPIDETIIKQFMVDFPRQDIFINDTKYDCTYKFMLEIVKYNRLIKINDKTEISLLLFILLIICQSSFYLQYEHVYTKLKMTNMFVLDAGKRKVIKIYLSDILFHVSFIAKHKIVNIDEKIKLYDYLSETIYDHYNDICIIIYHVLNNKICEKIDI